MRATLGLIVVSLFAVSCDSNEPSTAMDLSAVQDMAVKGDLTSNNGDMVSLPTLTVNNTDGWCTVTVTVGSAQAVTFADPSKAFQAAAGTVITLSASPNAGFTTVKWTGTTSNMPSTTYDMTSAAMQSVTACCPFTNGTGC